MSAQASAGLPLLVVIDPAARTMDGESVRIAKDVLRAGASSLKICLPDNGEELQRALAHRGRRRPVVIGDDHSLLRTVRILHLQGALGEAALSMVPVGQRSALALSRRLGVPQSAVAAARAALDGADRDLDLLLDESGGIVLGALRIPSRPAPVAKGNWLERGARSLARTLTGANGHALGQRLRVEADGVVLADLDRPVHEVSVRSPAGGLADVYVHHPEDGRPLRVRAQAVTISGRDYRYHADESLTGPVRTRTWTVQADAWRLTVPR
ncbi:diacylglycerol kinase [Streptantibioticus ferralitis]